MCSISATDDSQSSLRYLVRWSWVAIHSKEHSFMSNKAAQWMNTALHSSRHSFFLSSSKLVISSRDMILPTTEYKCIVRFATRLCSWNANVMILWSWITTYLALCMLHTDRPSDMSSMMIYVYPGYIYPIPIPTEYREYSWKNNGWWVGCIKLNSKVSL